MNKVSNNSLLVQLAIFVLLSSKESNDILAPVSGFSLPSGYSIHKLNGCSSSSSLLFSVTPPYDPPNLRSRSSSSDDCIDSDYSSSDISERREQQEQEQRRKRTLHHTQNELYYHSTENLFERKENLNDRIGKKMRRLKRKSSSISKNIFKFFGRSGDNKHDNESSNRVSNRRGHREDYCTNSISSKAHDFKEEPVLSMQGRHVTKKEKDQNTFNEALEINQNNLGHQSRINDRRINVRNSNDCSNVKEQGCHDSDKRKSQDSEIVDPYDYGKNESNSSYGDIENDSHISIIENEDDFSLDSNTNGNHQSRKDINFIIDDEFATNNKSRSRFNSDHHRQDESRQKNSHDFFTNNMELGDNIHQEQYSEISWKERVMAIERVPPIGIPAWGPEGDLGIDARMKATMDALEDIQMSKRKVREEEKIVLQICEDMTILQVDAAIAKKHYIDGNGDALMMKENVRRFEEEISHMSRSLRFAKLQEEEAKSRLVEVENLHWAVLSFYDPVQAKINIEKAILELEQTEPAARRTNFKHEK